MGELVGDDVGDQFCCSACVLVAGSTSSRFSRNVMQPRFSIAPAAKSGSASRSTLSARVRDAVVVLEPAQREGADVEAEPGEVPLAGHVDDAQRDAVDVDRLGRLERADDERHEVGAHRHRVGEAHARPSPSPASVRPTSGPLDTASERRIDDQRDLEHRLEVGLVPARERAPAVGRLHLRGGDDLLGAVVVAVRAAVPAAQLVVEGAGERDDRASTGPAAGRRSAVTNSRSVAASRRNGVARRRP